MKKILSIVTVAALVAACNTSPRTVEDSAKNTSYADTVGLAKFQAWKAQNELASYDEYNMPPTQSSTEITQKAVRSSAPVRKTTSKSRSVNETGTMSSQSQNTAKKKGWSKAAKGTVIGAGTGAVVGAVVNKRNRAVGAVIGGIAGGAVGYGIGRSKDKKDGRY